MKEITIKRITNKENEYLAYYKSNFLKATFCVAFNDNIFGSVALHHFSEMIKSHFNEEKLNLFICNENIQFKSQALLDEITKKEVLQ